MKSSRCPPEFEPNETSLKFCHQYGMTKKSIDKHVFAMKDHEYKQPKSDWDAAFRNWIRNAIKYGDLTPVEEHVYSMPEEISTSERERDILKSVTDMEKYRSKR